MIKIVSAILIALVISMLVLKLILWFLKRNSHFFDEMLKERNEEGLNKYSQGRVYLFLSICAYFIAISIVESVYKGFFASLAKLAAFEAKKAAGVEIKRGRPAGSGKKVEVAPVEEAKGE